MRWMISNKKSTGKKMSKMSKIKENNVIIKVSEYNEQGKFEKREINKEPAYIRAGLEKLPEWCAKCQNYDGQCFKISGPCEEHKEKEDITEVHKINISRTEESK